MHPGRKPATPLRAGRRRARTGVAAAFACAAVAAAVGVAPRATPTPTVPVPATSARSSARGALPATRARVSLGQVAYRPDRDESLPGVRYGFGGAALSVGITPAAVVFSLPTAPPEGAVAAALASGSAGEVRRAIRGRLAEGFTNVRMDFVDGDGSAPMRGESPLAFRTNVYRGGDPSQWRVGVSNYARVRAEGVYPGIDVVWHGADRHVEFDCVVAPGADPSRIALRFAVDRDARPDVRVEDDGCLVVASGAASMRLRPPRVFQDGAGGRTRVDARYVVRTSPDGRPAVAFGIAGYDRSLPLVIDPVPAPPPFELAYGSYLGGYRNDDAIDLARGRGGSMVALGMSQDPSFPAGNLYGAVGSYSAFVAALAPDGQVTSHAVLGGTGSTYPNRLAVHPVTGDVFLCGGWFPSSSPSAVSYPVTSGTLRGPGGGSATAQQGVVSVLTETMSLLRSTTLSLDHGMTLESLGITSGGNVACAVSTSAANLPVTAGAPYPSSAGGGFNTVPGIWVLDGPLTTTVASTYLGDANGTAGDIGIAPGGDLCLAGSTMDPNRPVVHPYQGMFGGGLDGWAARIDEQCTSVRFITYLGGTGFDFLNRVAVPPAGLTGLAGTFGVVGTWGGAPSLPLTFGSYGGGNDKAFAFLAPDAAPVVGAIGHAGNAIGTDLVYTGSGFFVVGYHTDFGEYSLVSGPGGGNGDIGIDPFTVAGQTVAADPSIPPFAMGGPAGDVPGGAVFLPADPDAGRPNPLFAVFSTAYGDGAAVTQDAAQAHNANPAGPEDRDTFLHVLEFTGAEPVPCPKPPKVTDLKVRTVRPGGADVWYQVRATWTRPAASPPIVKCFLRDDATNASTEVPFDAGRPGPGHDSGVVETYELKDSATHRISLICVNECGEVSDVAVDEAVLPDPKLKTFKFARKSQWMESALGTAALHLFQIDFFGTAEARGPDLPPESLAPVSPDLVFEPFQGGTPKRRRPTTSFRVQGALAWEPGATKAVLKLSDAGLTVPVKFKLSLTINGRTKRLSFTLKPPRKKA